MPLGKDGRLFMAGLDLAKREGAILTCSSDTDKIETIIPVEAGFWPNDLVLAPDGGFYFSGLSWQRNGCVRRRLLCFTRFQVNNSCHQKSCPGQWGIHFLLFFNVQQHEGV